MTRLRQISLPALLAFLLPPFFYPEQLLFGQSFYFMDLAWFHYPLRAYIADLWRSGTLPLWNPYSWMGFPLLAESEAGALGIVNAVFLLPIETWQALNLLVLLHAAVAGLCAYALARQCGASPWASLLAALSYAGGGWLTAELTNLNIMIGAAWAPLIGALLLHAIERRSARTAILAGIVFALQITSAHPQMPYYTIILFGAFTAWGLYQRRQSERSRGVPLWRIAGESGALAALAGAIGIGLSAPQWLTGLELLSLSRRAQGLPEQAQQMLSLPPVNVLALIFPRLFLLPTATWRTTGIFDEFHFYLGLIPLVCLAAAALRRDRPVVLFAFLLAALSAVLALGHFTPVYAIASGLPLLSSFRIPARWLFITSVAAIILIGHGADGLLALARDPSARPQLLRLRRMLTILYLALALTVPFALVARPPDDAALKQEDVFSIERVTTREQVVARLPGEAIAFALLGGAALAAFWALTLRPAARGPAAALLVIAGIDLCGASGAVGIAPSYWDGARPLAEFVKQNDPCARIFSTGGYLDVVPRLGDAEPAGWRVLASSGENDLPLGLQRTEDLLTAGTFLQYLRLTSTHWLVIPRELPKVVNRHARIGQATAAGLSRVWQSDALNVYEVPDPLPRVFVVYDVTAADTREAALAWLANPQSDVQNAAVVEDALSLLKPRTGLRATPARLRSYGALDVQVEADAQAPGLLVLTDVLYPGWRVWVDGVEQPIVRADYLFRGVWIGAGSHQVAFRFESGVFLLGALVSGITAATALVGWAIAPRMARR
ncbi:MAG: YfhO family protein [Chloroflexi bacterium]|nr:YfhO family protein [Chloroflexota bacterium]